MKSFTKLNGETWLIKKRFYNPLKGEHLKDAVYKNTKKMWNKLKIKTEGDCNDFSLKIDVLQHSFLYKHKADDDDIDSEIYFKNKHI